MSAAAAFLIGLWLGRAIDGTVFQCEAQSLCIHGDTPEAVEIARTLRQRLDAAGIAVRSAW
jgi:UPF0271 protein